MMSYELNEKRKKQLRDYSKSAFGRFAHRACRSNAGARHRKHEGTISGHEVFALWLRQNGIKSDAVKCAICGERSSEWQLDHVKPLSKGGMHDISNIQLVCHDCHKAKTSKERECF